MKKVIVSLTFMLAMMLMMNCNINENEEIQNKEFLKFKKNFPELSSKISYENIQQNNVDKRYISKSTQNIDAVTFPIMNNNKVIGRYLGDKSGNNAIYIDFNDFKNKIVIYDVNDPTKFQVLNMLYDESSNSYKPDLKYQAKASFWCKAACTVGAIAIASSDGPAPLMDILAYTYAVACLLDCELS